MVARAEATEPEPAPDRSGWTLWMGAALLVAVGLAQVWLVRDLKHLPSHLFGGDYSYQMGCIRRILASGNPVASGSVAGSLAHYLPLYGTLVALFTAASGLPVLTSMFVTSVLFRVLSVAVVGVVFGRLFGRATGLVVACLWAVLHPELVLKYTEFAAGTVVPLYFYTLYRYVERPAASRALRVGLMLAATGYSHSVGFIGGSLIAALTIAIRVALGPAPAGRLRALAAGAGHLLVVVACASLALGYWFKPIFVYHGKTSAHYAEWNGGASLVGWREQLDFARRFLLAQVQVWEWPRAALNLLVLAGLVCLWRTRERGRFLPGALIAGVAFACVFHYVVTMPLLHTHFVPNYFNSMLWGFAALFLAAVPVTLLLERVRGRVDQITLVSLVLAAALAGLVVGTRALARAPEMEDARTPLDSMFPSLQAFVLARTRANDVVLSTNELSFAWSALTGRKTLVTRRGHTDAFVDMDVRNKDAALVLYGRDDETRRRLLERYDVRYVLWTAHWIPSEYFTNEKNEVGYVDPLLYFQNEAYDTELAAADVKLVHFRTWVDPRLRGPEFPQFDLTFIGPENYRRPDHPWDEGLDRMMEEVWAFQEDGRKIAVLYRIRR